MENVFFGFCSEMTRLWRLKNPREWRNVPLACARRVPPEGNIEAVSMVYSHRHEAISGRWADEDDAPEKEDFPNRLWEDDGEVSGSWCHGGPRR